jgi:hypothetical protein
MGDIKTLARPNDESIMNQKFGHLLYFVMRFPLWISWILLT